MIAQLASLFPRRLSAEAKGTHLNEIVRGSSVTLLFRVAGIFIGYVFLLIVTRIFGAEAMGLLALALAVLNIASIIGLFGLDTAIVRFTAEHAAREEHHLVREAYIKSLKFLLPFSLLIAAALFFLSPLLSRHVFHKERLSPYFMAASVAVIPFVLAMFNAHSLRGLKRIKAHSFLRQISIYLFAAVILIMLLLEPGSKRLLPLTPVIAYVLSVFMAATMSFYLWFRESGIFRLGKNKDSLKMKTILTVSFPMLIASSFSMLMFWADTIMLGIYKSAADVGIYNIALKVANLTGISLFAVNTIAAPKIAELFGKRDYPGMKEVIRASTRLVFWSSVPLLLAIAFLPSVILQIFGREFVMGVTALLILAAAQFVNAIAGPVGAVLQMTGNEKVTQALMVFATLVNVALNLFLIPVLGINGAALASLFSMILWNGSAAFFIYRRFGILTAYVPWVHKLSKPGRAT